MAKGIMGMGVGFRIKRAAFFLLALGVLSACGGGPDRAKEAALLKEVVEAQVKAFETAMKGDVTYGDLAVSPVDGSDDYRVDMKDVHLKSPILGDVAIGAVAYLLTPQGEDLVAFGHFTLPPGPLTTAKGDWQLSAALSAFDGVWSRKLEAALSFKWEMADVRFSTKGGNAAAKSLKLSQESTDKGNGLYDMSGIALLEDVSAEGDGIKFALKEARIDTQSGAVELKALYDAKKRVQALAASRLEGIAEGERPKKLSDEDRKNLGEAAKILFSTIKNGGWSVSLADLAFDDSTEGLKAALEKIALSIQFSALDSDASMFDIGLSLDGLESPLGERDPVALSLVPGKGNFSLKAEHVPAKTLGDAIADEWGDILVGDLSTQAQIALALTLQPILSGAGTILTLAPSSFSNDVAAIDAEGAFHVDPKAILGAAGSMDITIRGLDDVMDLARAHPESPQSKDVLVIGQFLAGLADKKPGGSEKPAMILKIELTPAGAMLVNGRPMGM